MDPFHSFIDAEDLEVDYDYRAHLYSLISRVSASESVGENDDEGVSTMRGSGQIDG